MTTLDSTWEQQTCYRSFWCLGNPSITIPIPKNCHLDLSNRGCLKLCRQITSMLSSSLACSEGPISTARLHPQPLVKAALSISIRFSYSAQHSIQYCFTSGRNILGVSISRPLTCTIVHFCFYHPVQFCQLCSNLDNQHKPHNLFFFGGFINLTMSYT